MGDKIAFIIAIITTTITITITIIITTILFSVTITTVTIAIVTMRRFGAPGCRFQGSPPWALPQAAGLHISQSLYMKFVIYIFSLNSVYTEYILYNVHTIHYTLLIE